MLQHHSCIAKEGRLLICGIRVHYPYDTAPIHPPPARQTLKIIQPPHNSPLIGIILYPRKAGFLLTRTQSFVSSRTDIQRCSPIMGADAPASEGLVDVGASHFSRAGIHMVTVQRAQIAIVGEKHTSVRHDRVKSFASRWTAEGGAE